MRTLMMRGAVAFALAMAVPCPVSAAETVCPIVPVPKSYRDHGQVWRLAPADQCAIVVGAKATEPERYAAERLQAHVARRHKRSLAIVDEGHLPAAARQLLVCGQRATNALLDQLCTGHKIDLAEGSPGHDGFVIECLEDGARQVVVVGGSNARGVIYGLDALFDLLRAEGGEAVFPAVSVRDWPSIAWRGRPHSVLQQHLVPGALDAYVRARINFTDVRDDPAVKAGLYLPARKASMGFPAGVPVDRAPVKRVIDEDHRRGMFVYGTVSCGVEETRFPGVIRTFEELLELGVDGLWLSFDDTGAGANPAEIIGRVLELGRRHGMTDRRIAITPPSGAYQDIDRPFNAACAKVPGMEQAQWLFTRVPCQGDVETARAQGIRRLPGWWHNLVGITGGFLHNDNVVCTLRADDRPAYLDMQPLSRGWHAPGYEQLREAEKFTDCVLLWGVVGGWPEEYEVGALGLWAWNPAGHDWDQVRRSVYGYLYGPAQVQAAWDFDQQLADLKSLFSLPAHNFAPNKGFPGRLKKLADRARAVALIDKLQSLAEQLTARAPGETAIDPARLESVYLEPMRTTLVYARKMATLDYPEYMLPDLEPRMARLLEAGDRPAAEKLLAEIRPQVQEQLARIASELEGLKGLDGYLAWWQARITSIEAWQQAAKADRAKAVPRRAENFQPAGHVTRGIYADLRDAMHTAPWALTSGGCTLSDDRPRGGRFCLRIASTPGKPVQGASQRVVINQTEPRPVKIAGWSRAADVQAAKGYHYSIYVDFTFTDGKPWFMKLATFAPGTHDWQYAETIVTPPKPLARAEVHAFLRDAEGTAWFDDLFVGEAEGPNLLACPGFERDAQIESARRNAMFTDLAAIHANAIHGYLRSDYEGWDAPLSADNELLDFLKAAQSRGIGLWLTLGMRWPVLQGVDDPAFPEYACVNGPWAARWIGALGKAARYPLAGISVVPDEYNWNNSRLREAYAKHADPKVREFYERLPAYCACPECRQRFTARFGEPFPEQVPHTLPPADAAARHWLRFRYDSSTDWIARSVKAVKQVNPALRTDSLLCVSPICSDMWYGPGLAWDRLGYEAGLEYATTDPYILLQNYHGDSTHWYVTETTEHLAAAGPQRRCGLVLEGSRLRKEYRELDPVEIYGAALSAVWHGADELAWFHHHCLFGSHPLAPHPEMNRAAIAGVYSLLEKIDPWLDEAGPAPGVALLFSRASCDAWRLNVQAPGARPPFDTQGITEPRFAAQVQKEALYLLLRTGVPATLYYLESVRPEELSPHGVVLVPFALAIDPDRARFLEELSRQGKRVIVCGPDGPLDADGNPQAEPALKNLLADLPSLAEKQEFAERALGKGRVVYVSGRMLRLQAESRQNENRTHTEPVCPAVIDPEAAAAILHAVAGSEPRAGLPRPLLAGRLPEGDDVELCLAANRRGERLLLAVNWDRRPRSVELGGEVPWDRAPAEAYTLGADGRWSAREGAISGTLTLEGQQSLVARFPAGR